MGAAPSNQNRGTLNHVAREYVKHEVRRELGIETPSFFAAPAHPAPPAARPHAPQPAGHPAAAHRPQPASRPTAAHRPQPASRPTAAHRPQPAGHPAAARRAAAKRR